VRKLIEYVEALDDFPPAHEWQKRGYGATGQALLDAALIHIRNLGAFLRPGRTDTDHAYATHYAAWTSDSFLDGPPFGRVSAKVAHLSHSRLRFKLDDWQPEEIRPLAVECLSQMRDFFDGLPPEWVDAFAEAREHVERFLPTS